MSELIGNNKKAGFTPEFDTHIPELIENANIQEALKYLFWKYFR